MRNMLARIGFIDETSLKTNMAKTTGRAPCGARLVDHAPFGRWNTQTRTIRAAIEVVKVSAQKALNLNRAFTSGRANPLDRINLALRNKKETA